MSLNNIYFIYVIALLPYKLFYQWFTWSTGDGNEGAKFTICQLWQRQLMKALIKNGCNDVNYQIICYQIPATHHYLLESHLLGKHIAGRLRYPTL